MMNNVFPVVTCLLCFLTLAQCLDTEFGYRQPEQHPAEAPEKKSRLADIWSSDSPLDHKFDKRFQTWIWSILASCVIGLSGIVPLVFIPVEMGLKLSQDHGGCGGKYLRLLLSFAVGGLLGDVFLHLLPEAWNSTDKLGDSVHSKHLTLGLWVLVGMFSFVVLEIMFTASENNRKVAKSLNSSTCVHEDNCLQKIHPIDPVKSKNFSNGCLKAEYQVNGSAKTDISANETNIHVAGYLNLMANSIDNFTHGLAVAASFLVGCKMGVLTTFAILIHEIPHEIGDFAILLKSGFHPWSAAKAQISTATIGILGVIVALSTESDRIGVCTSWILPFTSGGFLNIALVNVLPDLLKEKDPWESVKQLGCLCAGIGIMALVSILVH